MATARAARIDRTAMGDGRWAMGDAAPRPDGRSPAVLGRTIAGKLRIESLLGGGAMGAFYKARQIALDKDVAIELLHGEHAGDAMFAARFQREAKAASKPDHGIGISAPLTVLYPRARDGKKKKDRPDRTKPPRLENRPKRTLPIPRRSPVTHAVDAAVPSWRRVIETVP